MKSTFRIVAGWLLSGLVVSSAFAGEVPDDRFGPADIARLADVAEPAFAPDGTRIAYTVTVTDIDEDRQQSDLWRVDYDGAARTQLTFTPQHDEWSPRWSPDGRWLAFLSDRGDEDATTQVWAMPASGGEARALTSFAGGVDDFDWSPDGRRLAVIAFDPSRPVGTPKPKNPPPIVTERFNFKQDVSGYLTALRQHLYVVDLDDGKVEQLTSGAHDQWFPTWSPDGKTIAFVTRRGADPDRHANFDLYTIEPRAGAVERRLTTYEGADNDPDTESRPQWSPDSRRIAYLQRGADKWIYYSPSELAIVDVASGRSTLPVPLDRWVTKPRWSHDGRHVYALVEQSRVTHLVRIDTRTGATSALTPGARFDADFDVAADGRIVVLGGDDVTPYELAAVERGKPLRPLGSHNAWLAQKRLVRYEDITFRSADGTAIEGFVVKPVDYVAGRKYPTVLRIHGGPVYQYSHEFMPDWQSYAARGYVVVAANPRGSSGRGFDFARAIFADWGHKDVQDVLAAVDHVVAQGLADPGRLGVGGRSYGGILTNYVVASDRRFKAAVSGAGASHWAGLYGYDMYTREYEAELGVPWRNRDVYDRLSYPFFHADRIATPTLFYCAEADFNVPCQGSEQMYQALRSLDVPTQLVVYPGEHHALRVPSYLRDRMQRLLDWYDRWLRSE
ncbi:MAG TPA: S9 family peptidase [Steroidobacteraceae bacterium]|nr:S9 family peptidase [Steroidobacteraceae bacterium]